MSGIRLFFCLFIMGILSFAHSYGATGGIDTTTRYQTIEGFGGANVWSGSTLKALGNNNPGIYDVIFGDLGLDILRLRNTYGYDPTYINNCEHTVTNGRAYTGRPLKLMISAWSPQASLKSNGSIPGGDDATLDGGPDNYVYQDYADWWADSLEQYASQDMVADYVNMQNEPDYDASWDSCRFEPNETSTIAGYNEAFDAVYTEINSRVGSTISAMPKMLVSDCTGLNRAGEYIDCIYNPSQVYGYSHHLYNCSNGGNSGCGDDPDLYIPAMTSFGSSYNDKPIIQTEYSDDSHVTTYDACMDLALLMHNCLVVEGASGYIYWQLTYTDIGLVAITSTSWTINPVYYAMMHYSAFTDPNWQRVDASTNSSDLRISAYISPDGNELSVVIINTNTTSGVNLDLSFTGFAIDEGGVYQTTTSQYCTLVDTYNGSGTLTIPANSITTLSLAAATGPQQTLNISSTSGGSVTTPGEGDFQYPQDSNASIVATPEWHCHFDGWSGSAVTAGKVADPCSASTTVLMDANYAVVANFEDDPPSTDVEILGDWVTGTTHTAESGLSRALIFVTHAEDNVAITLNSVTYGSQSMTPVIEGVTSTSGYRAYVAAYILDEADIDAATSGTFVPDWGTTPENVSYASVFLGSVDQTDPIGAIDSAITTTGTDPISTSALETNEGDMVILGATCGNAGDYILINGFTEGIENDMPSSTGTTGYKSATGADETPGVDFASNVNRQVIIGFVVQAMAGTIDYPPAAPTGLVATAGNAQVSLDWADNGEADLAGYNVYRSMTQGSGYSQINVSTLLDSDYVDNDVNNLTPYYYVVTAVDANDNESGYSDEDSATPDYQNCAQVQAGGYGLVSDLTGDCYVDLWDLEKIAFYWLYTNCGSYGDCEGADFEPDSDVDLIDFSDFAVDWLLCNDPGDSDCLKNW